MKWEGTTRALRSPSSRSPPSLCVPKPPASIGRGKGSGRAGWQGRGGAGGRLVSPGVWSQGRGLSAPTKRGEQELCGECKESRASSQPGAADGVLSHSPMRREQIIYSLIPVRVPGAGEWRGLGGGSSAPPAPPPAGRPLPAPAGSRRAHTHFLTISEHTLAARPPAAPQLLSPARRAARLGRLGAKLPRRRAAREGWPPAAVGRARRAGWVGHAGPGLGGCKREEKRKKSKAVLAPLPLLWP